MVGTILADNTTHIPNSVPGFYGDNCLEDLVNPSSFVPTLKSNMIGKLENCTRLAPSPGWPNIGYGSTTVHANLSALAYNSTSQHQYVGPTYLPLSNSAVIHGYSRYGSAGNSTFYACPTFDQHGYARLSTDTCDIGAADYTAFH
jgi:hypothetical protein